MIDITGINKAEVLAALYNNSKPQGLGFFNFTQEDMTVCEAQKLLEETTYFDYIKGRVMKVDLRSDTEFEEYLYDRDNGPGAAERVIVALREKIST